MFKKKKQIIGCNVETCKYCDCNNNLCLLPKIDVSFQDGKEGNTTTESTICASFKYRKNG